MRRSCRTRPPTSSTGPKKATRATANRAAEETGPYEPLANTSRLVAHGRLVRDLHPHLRRAHVPVRNLVLGVEVSPAERGYQVAINAGCFNRKHHPSAPACIRPHGSDVAPMTMQQPPRASGERARRCMA